MIGYPAEAIEPSALRRAAAVIKCLGHPTRLRLLELLAPGELAVTTLVERTGASQAAVSQQLGVLRGRGLVATRREGPFVLYRIAEPRIHDLLDWVRAAADETADIA